MRCFTFQNISVVTRWLKLLSDFSIVTRDNIDGDNFHFTQSRTKDCYEGKDFIYTFYHYTYDEIDYPKYWLKDNYYLTNILKWYFSGFRYEELAMIELNISNDVGIFGELDSVKVVSEHYVQNNDKVFEYVLPYLNKDWIVDYYLFKKIPDIPINNGIEIIPVGYTKARNKLIKSNAPLVWDRSIYDFSLDDITGQENSVISSVPFDLYRDKCRVAFYGIESKYL